MLYLVLAVISGTAKGFCGKKLSGHVNSISESAAANIIRMIICCVIGAAMAFVKHESFALTPAELAISVFSGISMAVFLISWLISAKSGAYMMINAVTTAAFIVNMVFGFFVFGESISIKQVFSVIFIIAAIAFLLRYSSDTKEKLKASDYVLLAVVFLSQGFTNVAQKMFTAWAPDGSKVIFNFYTFLITLAVLCIAMPFLAGKEKKVKLDFKKCIPYIAVMAAMLFANSYFLTAATEVLPSVILFPLSSVLSLAAATVMAAAFFGEKITKTSAAGILCTVISVLLT